MKSDFLIALTQLAAERNLPREVVLSAIEAALVSAYKKDSITAGQNISVKLDPGTGEVRVYVLKTVVDEVNDPQTEIKLEDARRIKPSVAVGETIATESFPHSAGRIAAQTAKQVVMQRLREAERELVFQEYADKEGEVFSVTVQRVEPKQVVVDLARAEAVMPASEQVPQERYRSGQKVKVLLQKVARSSKGPELIVSRADKLLLKRLFEMEVPEIYNGAVEIVAIAREPGSRSKVAVRARQDGVDPVGSCVGLRGVRIQNIVNELHGEKIDVVEWSKDPAAFIANALSPSKVLRVALDSERSTAVAVVPERELSLAIGKEGQNARLAAKLTGWKVDIKSSVEWEAGMAERAKAAPAAAAAMAEPEPAAPSATVEAVAEPVTAEPAQVEAPERETEPVAAELAEAPAAEEEAVEATVAEVEPVEAEPAVEEPEAVLEEEPVAEEAEVIEAEAEVEPIEELLEPEPVGSAVDRSSSLRDLPEDVWSVRRARMSSPPEPGRIRFAEDILGPRGGRGRRERDREDDARGPKRKTKAGKKRR